MRIHAVVTLLAVWTQTAPPGGAGGEDDVKKDLAALKGTWIVVSAVRDGKDITDNNVTLTHDGSGRRRCFPVAA